jgi:hypothetical protein
VVTTSLAAPCISRAASGLARRGEILVSRTVVDLTAGSGITYDTRGEHELKGIPMPGRSSSHTRQRPQHPERGEHICRSGTRLDRRDRCHSVRSGGRAYEYESSRRASRRVVEFGPVPRGAAGSVTTAL